MQGFTWLYLPSPFVLPYVLFFSEENGGYPLIRTLDNFLFLTCLAFCAFALTMAVGVLENLYKNMSEVDKLKVGRLGINRPKRSVKEIIEIVFGDNPSWVDYFLPTPKR